MRLCFGFGIADVVAESDEVRVVCFEPLRIAVPGEEIWVCEDGSQEIQVCLDARDGCILKNMTGFADSIVPCASCYNDLCNDTVEVRTDTGWDTVNKRRVHAGAVT